MNIAMWTAATRAQHMRDGLRFASDLTDAEWAVLEPLLPSASTLCDVMMPGLDGWSVLNALCRRRETVEHPFGTIKQWMNFQKPVPDSPTTTTRFPRAWNGRIKTR